MRKTAIVPILAMALAAPLTANTYTVTSTADSGAGTLRQAITDANTNPGADTVAFNVVGSGVHTMAPATPLPPITDAVTIDGYTQPGSSANTNPVGQGLNTVLQIEIAGTATAGSGLDVRAQNVTVRGLVINRFSLGQVNGNGSFDHSHMTVEGCFLGTTPDGLTAYTGATSIYAKAPDFRIGGPAPAQRNLIAGTEMVRIEGSAGGVFQGNLVGTDLGGTRRIAGLVGGEIGIKDFASGVILIGGTDPNAGNVIAGVDQGIFLDSATTTIQGNFFGVDAAQSGVITSGTVGIHVNHAGGKIGGTGAGERNVIGGFDNGLEIVNTVTLQGNFIGTDTTATKNFGNRVMGILVQRSGQAVGGLGPGEGNVIAFNGWVGVLVTYPAVHCPIRGNRIFNNGIGGVDTNGQGMAIDLHFYTTPGGPNPNDEGDGDSGNGNDFQNFPLITSAVPEGGGTRVIGTLNSLASTVFDLDFYANPSCRARPRALLQAETYIGSIQVTTDASGNASFNQVLPTPIDAGSPVTATATAPNGDTSELWQEIVFKANRGVGGPGDNFSQELTGQLFEDGATLTIGGNAVSSTVDSPTRIDFVGPALSPGGIYDVTVTNPSGLSGTVHNGYVSRFSDVTYQDLFDLHISKLIAGGITAGCGGGNYCTSSSVTRQQMAVFVLKSKHGICYAPPPCQGVFADVPCSSNFAPWVEQFAAEGITGGCGGGNYCPLSNVRRDQMAVFLLKGKYGSTLTPPPCTGAFPDVPCPSTFADWIEELAAEGVTGGCGGGDYCPGSNVTRGQMAAFLVKAFSLP